MEWICKTWTGFVKGGFVRGGFVKHGFVKGGFVKNGFVKGGFVKDGFVKGGFFSLKCAFLQFSTEQRHKSKNRFCSYFEQR